MPITLYQTPAALPWAAATYYDNSTAIPGVVVSFTVTVNRLIAVPLYVPSPVTISRIGTVVSTLGGTNARLGIYAPGSNGYPGSLLLDAGTIATGSTGFKEVTGLSLPVAPSSVPYVWLAIVSDGAPVLSGMTPQRALLGTDANAPYGHVYVAQTFGALPTTFGTPTLATSSPRISVRTA